MYDKLYNNNILQRLHVIYDYMLYTYMYVCIYIYIYIYICIEREREREREREIIQLTSTGSCMQRCQSSGKVLVRP